MTVESEQGARTELEGHIGMENTQAHDLVVVGGGLAGLAAANRARQLGRSVVVLERGTDVLYACNSRFAGGVLHISYQNLNDPPESLGAAALKITAGAADRALVDTVAQHALRAVRWLADEGCTTVRVGEVGWRQFILAPPRPPVTRMDWEGRGADMTLRRLEENLRARGAELRRGTRAVRLIMREGRCVGVEAEQGGRSVRFDAGAVLLADGGFQAAPALVARYISAAPGKLLQRCAPTGTGDGLRMAMEAGAGTRNLEAFYGHVLSRDAMHDDALWPYPMVDDLVTAGIVVDGDGRRFADEGLGGIFVANAVARLADPLTAAVVFDEAAWCGPGRSTAISPNPVLVSTGGTVHRAESLTALSERLQVPAAALEKTVACYNRALDAGAADTLDPRRTTQRYRAMPIRTAPFYAIPVCAAITYTMGGIAIDAASRVLRTDGTVLPGLYAAGSTTGGLDGGPACGYVGGLVKALVFGLRAAEHLGTSHVRAEE
jgi:fumarate reductase flavoprotein subunit